MGSGAMEELRAATMTAPRSAAVEALRSAAAEELRTIKPPVVALEPQLVQPSAGHSPMPAGQTALDSAKARCVAASDRLEWTGSAEGPWRAGRYLPRLAALSPGR